MGDRGCQPLTNNQNLATRESEAGRSPHRKTSLTAAAASTSRSNGSFQDDRDASAERRSDVCSSRPKAFPSSSRVVPASAGQLRALRLDGLELPRAHQLAAGRVKSMRAPQEDRAHGRQVANRGGCHHGLFVRSRLGTTVSQDPQENPRNLHAKSEPSPCYVQARVRAIWQAIAACCGSAAGVAAADAAAGPGWVGHRTGVPSSRSTGMQGE
jgi:hypothetical protein